jgi:hypothetical protein
MPQILPVVLYSFQPEPDRAADDALDRDDRGLLDEHGTLGQDVGEGGQGRGEILGFRGQEMVGQDQADEIEPELRQLRQDLALVRDERGQDPVKGRDAVRGYDQELVADLKNVPDFALFEKRHTGQLKVTDGVFHDISFGNPSRIAKSFLKSKCQGRPVRGSTLLRSGYSFRRPLAGPASRLASYPGRRGAESSKRTCRIGLSTRSPILRDI